MTETALLLTALLFGGAVLYSFGFAAFVFSALPADLAGSLLRRAFPHFYLFVLGASAAGGALAAFADSISAAVLAAIAGTTLVARQILMPAINSARDGGRTDRFRLFHSLSVMITLAHIAGAAVALVRLAALT
ncbi:MAG: DUF4149 domain-containing protein [Erythrobacter sp.]|uniref:DUF4149 domain-containing protein n=1 Tax=Erythrobacter sp. TaxID=1042 RepID=UPI0032EF2AA1